MNGLSVSIIVCTCDRYEFLDTCLNSLTEQDSVTDSWEILVVDNGSTDQTSDVILEYKKRLKNLTSIHVAERNLSIARNMGCNIAKGKYLVYLDDDAKVPKDYLVNVFKVLQEQAPDLLGGPVYPYYTSNKPSWFKDEFETKKFTTQSEFSTTCRVTGANFIIKKSVLMILGMFDPARGMQGKKYVIGDERKVVESYRISTPPEQQKIYYSLECFVYHHVAPRKMEFTYFIYRQFVGGKTNVLIRSTLKNEVKPENEALREFVRFPKDLLTRFNRKKKNGGLKHGDSAEILAWGALRMGVLVESLKQHLSWRLGFRKQGKCLPTNHDNLKTREQRRMVRRQLEISGSENS